MMTVICMKYVSYCVVMTSPVVTAEKVNGGIYQKFYLRNRIQKYVMGWPRPRLQTCQLSPRAGRPEDLFELSFID